MVGYFKRVTLAEVEEQFPSDYECDVCGARVARLRCVEVYGIETYACDACTGREPEEG